MEVEPYWQDELIVSDVISSSRDFPAVSKEKKHLRSTNDVMGGPKLNSYTANPTSKGGMIENEQGIIKGNGCVHFDPEWLLEIQIPDF